MPWRLDLNSWCQIFTPPSRATIMENKPWRKITYPLPGPLNDHIFMDGNGEATNFFICKDLVHHTNWNVSPTKTGCLRFQVQICVCRLWRPFQLILLSFTKLGTMPTLEVETTYRITQILPVMLGFLLPFSTCLGQTPHSTPMEHAIKIPNCPYWVTILRSIIEWHLQTGFRDNDSIWKSFSFYLRVNPCLLSTIKTG